MTSALELQFLPPCTWVWQAYDREAKCDLCSTALRLNEGILLVDPIRLPPSALDELQQIAQIRAVVVTNENHARSTASFCAPVFASAAARKGLGLETGQTKDPTELGPEVQMVELPGGPRGEIALFVPAHATLVVGDALINFEPYGFAVLPEKYCQDQKQLLGSLRTLLDLPFSRLFFAHGTPLMNGARSRLARLLEQN